MKIIDIVVPCYNEQECITLLYSAVDDVFKKINEYDYKLWFIITWYYYIYYFHLNLFL